MMQRRFTYLLCASLLIVAVANCAQLEERTALQFSEMKEPRQRMPRSVRRRTNKPVYQFSSSVEEVAENPRSLNSLPELNTSTDIDKFIHTPLGKDILSTVVTSLMHQTGQDNSIFAEILENPQLLWDNDNKVVSFREEKQYFPEQERTTLPPRSNNKGFKEKQHFPKQEITTLPPRGNNKGFKEEQYFPKQEITTLPPPGNNKDFKEKSSNSLSTVVIISPALLPGQEEFDMDEWNFRDPRITSEHQVIRLNVNKNAQELLSVLSSVQPGEVASHHRTVRSKQPRTFSERSEENFDLGSRYNMEYTQNPTQSPPYNNDYYYYEYPQDDCLDKEINEQEYETLDYDYHDDVHFEDDFTAANLGRIASHKYNQLRFFWDLFHHGWPLWLEK